MAIIPSTMREIRDNNKLCAIDLFCGVGGLTHGLESAGVDVVLGIDIDPACEFPYKANNKAEFLLKSVEEVSTEELSPLVQDSAFTLIAGCAPCQTFSTYNQKAKSTDKRWWLLLEFSRLIRELSPELVTMENVPGLIKQSVFDDFINELKQNDHHTGDASFTLYRFYCERHIHRYICRRCIGRAAFFKLYHRR